MNQPSSFDHVAPLGTSDVTPSYYGRARVKPWDYALTAAIPHLGTIEPLKMAIELLRAQTARPFIMVVDTGSEPSECAQLERLRAEDIEIHYVRAHAYRSPSEPVTVALDLVHTLCRTEHVFHTHADCFLRRQDFLESVMRVTNCNTPVVGYRLSPRDWATDEWKWMVGHTATMCYLPTLHRIGATWSFQRIKHQWGYPWQITGGWPDTETGFNHCLRAAGIVPVFIGHDRNHERQVDDNIDHCRSYPCSKVYDDGYHSNARGWMEAALREGRARLVEWRTGKRSVVPAGYFQSGSCVDNPTG
jgi:hypothetical protein